MWVTLLAIDLTYVDPECLSWTRFCCFVLEMSWKFFVKSVWTPCNTCSWNDHLENYRTSIKKMKKLYLYLFLYIFLLMPTEYKFGKTKKKIWNWVFIFTSNCIAQKTWYLYDFVKIYKIFKNLMRFIRFLKNIFKNFFFTYHILYWLF